MRALRQAMFATDPGTHEVELEGHRILFERTATKVTMLACFVDGEQTFPRPEPGIEFFERVTPGAARVH